MLGYIEYLGVPASIAIILVGILLFLQLIGEFLEFKGKIVPEFMKIRKYFARRKKEKEALHKVVNFVDKYEEMASTLTEVQTLLKDVREHYSDDNITKRDGWMREVNEHIVESEQRRLEQARIMQELAEKLDKNNADTLKILIDNQRNYLLDFTSKAVDLKYPLTKEQYQRFFNVHSEYEKILEENDMVNGQVDAAYSIVTKSFEERLKQHAFIEDSIEYSV